MPKNKITEKPKVAFFDFACCEGCQLQISNLGETLLDLLGVVDVVEFREVMSEKWDKDYDVVFIEGSIGDQHAEERLKKNKKQSKNSCCIWFMCYFRWCKWNEEFF